MAKRVYQPKPQPLSVQIEIQRARVAQDERALEQAREDARVATEQRMDMFGARMTDAQVERVQSLVPVREQQLAFTRQRLAELEAQQST